MGRSSQSPHSTNTVTRGPLHKAMLEYSILRAVDSSIATLLRVPHLGSGRLLGAPEIFNTDQGSQFTSEEWLAPLKAAGAAISMDARAAGSTTCSSNGCGGRRGVLRRSGRHRARGSLKVAELLPPLRGVGLHCGEDIDEDRRGRDHHHQPAQTDPLIPKRNLSQKRSHH